MRGVLLPVFFVIAFSCQKGISDKQYKEESTDTNTWSGQSKYRLVWQEEFNYTGLPDSSKWDYEIGYLRNNEEQFYTARNLLNSKVNNGKLTITARYDSTQQNGVTSASIITKGKLNFLYGRIEVKAKMPTGAGAWPAIWTLGINRSIIGWPKCGEIDILEWFGKAPQYVLGSIYTTNDTGTVTQRYTPYVPADFATLSNKFHKYAVEWDSTEIRYYYDTINFVTYKAGNLTPTEWEPFTKPHYLLLNLALGGSAGGTIDYSKFPFTYQIDYVRYYRKL